jgi:hypothetical protein
MDDPTKFGFWSSLQGLRGRDIINIELLAALLVGLGGGIALLSQVSVSDRTTIALDFIYLIGPLLGVVFASFALVIALFSDSYLRVLNSHPDGAEAFMRPFMVTIGVQVGSLLLTIAYRASAAVVPSKVEVAGWLATSFLFTYAVLDVVALGRAVFLHGLTRAADLEVRDLEAKSHNVLPHRRAEAPD